MNNAYYTLELREHKGLSSWACTPTRSPGAYLVGMCPQTVLDQELLRHPDTLFVLHNSVKAHNLPDSLHPLSLLCFWFEILTLYLICWTPCWTPYLLYHLLKLPLFLTSLPCIGDTNGPSRVSENWGCVTQVLRQVIDFINLCSESARSVSRNSRTLW